MASSFGRLILRYASERVAVFLYEWYYTTLVVHTYSSEINGKQKAKLDQSHHSTDQAKVDVETNSDPFL